MRAKLFVLAVLLLSAIYACGSDEIPSEFDAGNGTSSGGRSDAASSGFSSGDGGGSSGLLPISELFFDPPEATLTLSDSTPKTASYTLKGKLPGGQVVSVPSVSVQFDRPDLASLKVTSQVELTTKNEYAGIGNLRAVYNGRQASAKLNVILSLQVVGAGVDAAAVTALKQAGLAQDPSLSAIDYPYDKTVFPLGLSSPLFMWKAPKPTGDTYRIRLSQSNYVFDGFYAVTAPARLRVEQRIWDRITASNVNEPLNVEVSRYDAATQKAYASAKQSYTIVPASLRGAIYYWTTSGGGHLSRIRPGTGSAPEVLNNGKCMGCHGVSADGSTLVAVEEDRPSNDETTVSDRAWVSYDLPAATIRKVSTSFGGNVAVNPNGKYVVYGNQQLKLADTKTGTLVANSDLATMQANPTYPDFAKMMTPAFSPDGKKFAAISGLNPSIWWYHNMKNGHLVVMDFDETTLKFSNAKALAAAADYPVAQRGLSYPSFTPDSAHIAFHVGDYPTGCDAQGCEDDTKQIGSVHLQKISGAPPINLATLNDGAPNVADRNLTFEPTFNPVERGGYFWVVVTSMRDWGNKVTGVANNGKKRLWVAAIDKNIGTVDPSHPPFFLEGQEEGTTNMRGFWALAACIPTQGTGGGACQAGFECCSGFCDLGVCVDPGAAACKPAGEVCTKDEECCNSPTVTCVNGRCKLPDPK
ncbi:MAG: dickkopf-related protein [Polyangiaceae bacterium]